MRLLELISEAPIIFMSEASPGQTIAKINAQTIGVLQKKWRMNTRNTARWEKIWMGKYGTGLTFLMKFLQVAGPLTYLYSDLDSLDQEYKAGNVNGTDLESGREFLFGMFATEIVTPIVVRYLANTRMVLMLVNVMKRIFAGLAAIPTAGASIAVAVGSEAFYVWLQNWLASDKGKDWIINTWIMNGIVRTMGQGLDAAWSSLTGYYEDKPDAGKSGSIAKEKAVVQAAEKKQAALSRPPEQQPVPANLGVLGPQVGELDPTKIRRGPANTAMKF
jgi:hypothetical protein